MKPQYFVLSILLLIVVGYGSYRYFYPNSTNTPINTSQNTSQNESSKENSPQEKIIALKAAFLRDPQNFDISKQILKIPKWANWLSQTQWPEWIHNEEKLKHFLLRAALTEKIPANGPLIENILKTGTPDERILALQWAAQSKKLLKVLKLGLEETQPVEVRLFSASQLPPFQDFSELQTRVQQEKDWRVQSLLMFSTLEEAGVEQIEQWLTQFPGPVSEAVARKFLGANLEQKSADLLALASEKKSKLQFHPVFKKRFQFGILATKKKKLTPFLRNAYLYLARHQEKDGSFDCSKQNPFHNEISLPGFSFEDDQVDTAVTALMMLTFLGGGNTEHYGLFADQVQMAKKYLLKRQKNGKFETTDSKHHTSEVFIPYANARQIKTHRVPKGGRTLALVHRYNHSVSLLAMLELYGMTLDSGLIESITKGLNESAQKKQGNLKKDVISSNAFSYYIELGDVATTSFLVESVLLGEQLGFKVEEQLKKDLEEYLLKTNLGKTGPHAKSHVRAYCFSGHSSVAVALVMEVLWGFQRKSIQENERKYILSHLPNWNLYSELPKNIPETQKDHGDIVDFHYWYYGVRALHLTGDCQSFQNRLRKIISFGVLKYGDECGSMKPEGIWCRVGGRLYSTAMTIKALQVESIEVHQFSNH